jgi:hypothetical protein
MGDGRWYLQIYANHYYFSSVRSCEFVEQQARFKEVQIDTYYLLPLTSYLLPLTLYPLPFP